MNPQLTDIVLTRLEGVDNRFTYKSETPADMTEWGEPAVEKISAWVLRMARQFTEKVIGKTLDEAFSEGNFNSAAEANKPTVGVGIGRSWASVYHKGDRHQAHFHPNTAISAIYYVTAPGTCDLDLIDPPARTSATSTQESPSPATTTTSDSTAHPVTWSSSPAGSNTPYPNSPTTQSASPCPGTSASPPATRTPQRRTLTSIAADARTAKS